MKKNYAMYLLVRYQKSQLISGSLILTFLLAVSSVFASATLFSCKDLIEKESSWSFVSESNHQLTTSPLIGLSEKGKNGRTNNIVTDICRGSKITSLKIEMESVHLQPSTTGADNGSGMVPTVCYSTVVGATTSIINVTASCVNEDEFTVSFDVEWDYIDATSETLIVELNGMPVTGSGFTPTMAVGVQSFNLPLTTPSIGNIINAYFSTTTSCTAQENFDVVPDENCVLPCGVSCATTTLLDPDPSSPDYLNSGNFGSTNAPQLTSGTSWSGVNNVSTTQFVGMLFGTPSKIEGVTTKGRGNVAQWVTSYQLEATKDGTNWISLGTYTGNTDQNTEVFNPVSNTDDDWIGLRINPLTWVSFPSMRFQFTLGENCTQRALGGEAYMVSDGGVVEGGQPAVLVEIYACNNATPVATTYTNINGD